MATSSGDSRAICQQTAELIKQVRAEAGLNQSQLAQLVGVSQAYVSQLESGRANPTILVLKRIFSRLGLHVVLIANGGEGN